MKGAVRMRRGFVNRIVHGMSESLKRNGDKRYEYMDSERFTTPAVVKEGNHFEVVADFKGADEEGYEVVKKLNCHKLLVNEIAVLTGVLLEIHDMIPLDKIQHDDPNKDELLSKISSIISSTYYGTVKEKES